MTTSGEWQPAEDLQPESTNVRGTLFGFSVFPTANSQAKSKVLLTTPPKGSQSAKHLNPGPPSDVAFRPKQPPDRLYGAHRNSATCDIQMYRGIDAYLSQGEKEGIQGGGGGVAPPNTPLRLREVSFKLDPEEEDSLAPSAERRTSSAQPPRPPPLVLRSKSETKIKPLRRENQDGNLTPERSYSLNGSAHASATNLSSFKGMTSPLDDEENASDVSKAAAFISSVVQQSLCPEKLSAHINALKRERNESPSARKGSKPTAVSPYFGASITSGYNGVFSPLAESTRLPPLTNGPELPLIPSLKNAIAVNTIISHLNSSKQTFPRGLIEPPSSVGPTSASSVKPGLFSLTSAKVTKKTDVTPPLSPLRVPISSEPIVFLNTESLPIPHTPYIPPQSHKEAVSILTSHITPLIKPEKRTFFLSTRTNGASKQPGVSLPQGAVTHCTPPQTTVSATSSQTPTTNNSSSLVTLKEGQFSPPSSVISPESQPLSGAEDSNSTMEADSKKKSGSFYRGKVVKNKAVDVAQHLDSRLACHTYSTKFPMDVICQGRLLETKRKTSPDFDFRDDPNSATPSHSGPVEARTYRTSRSMSTGRMEFGRRRSRRVSSVEDPDETRRLERAKMEREIAPSAASLPGPTVDAPDSNVCLTCVGNAAYSGLSNDAATKEGNLVDRQGTIAIAHARSRLPKLRTSHSFNVKLVEADGANLGVKGTLVAAPVMEPTDIGDRHVRVTGPIEESFPVSDVKVVKPSMGSGRSSSPPTVSQNEHSIGGQATDLSGKPKPNSAMTAYPAVKTGKGKAAVNSDLSKEGSIESTSFPTSPKLLEVGAPRQVEEAKDGFDCSLVEGHPGGTIVATESPAGPAIKSVTETFCSVDETSSETTLQHQRGSKEREVVENVIGTRTSPLEFGNRAHGKGIPKEQEEDVFPKWVWKEFVNIEDAVSYSEHSQEPHVIGTGCACPGLHGHSVESPSPIRGSQALESRSIESAQSPPVPKYEDSAPELPATEESSSQIPKLEDLSHRDPRSEATVSWTSKARDPPSHVVNLKDLDSRIMNPELSLARGRCHSNSPLRESQNYGDPNLCPPKRGSPASVNLRISDGTESLIGVNATASYTLDDTSFPLTLNTPGAVIDSGPEGFYQASLPEPVRPLTFVVEEMFEFIDDNASSPPADGVEGEASVSPAHSPAPPTALPSTQASAFLVTEGSTRLPVLGSDQSLKGNEEGSQESATPSLENIPPASTAPSLAASLSFPISSPPFLSPSESLLPKTRSTLTTAVIRITTQGQPPISQEVWETFVRLPRQHKADLMIASRNICAELNWPLAFLRVAAWPRRFPWHCFFAGLLLIAGLVFFTARLPPNPPS